MFIVAAGTLRYGDIVEVIDAAKGAGVEKVGIVTEGMRAEARRRRLTARASPRRISRPAVPRPALAVQRSLSTSTPWRFSTTGPR
jgi:hypothetical protein